MTNKLTDLVNNIFNVKPNEQVVKSLVGELQIPPKNTLGLFTKLRDLTKEIDQDKNYKTIKLPNEKGENDIMTKDLTIQIVPKLLELTDDQKQKIENYNKALAELPVLEVAISLDGGKTFGGDTLKINTKKLFDDVSDEKEDDIVVDDNELVDYILDKRFEYNLDITKEDIQKVLDLEFEFLKLNGVIE